MNHEKTEKVIETAREIFMRYGFRRVTMGDIAEAAKMSRPALYLVFPSKEEILAAVVNGVFRAMLDEIREGVQSIDAAEERLKFAFEVWSVRPFEMVKSSPDAKDFLESSYEFAGQATAAAFAEFESIVAEILKPQINSRSSVKLSAVQIARILTSAVYGFKNTAADADELRRLINGLIAMILASLQK